MVVGRAGRESVCVGGLVRISRCSSLGSGFANVADKSEETRTMKILERIIIEDCRLESFRIRRGFPVASYKQVVKWVLLYSSKGQHAISTFGLENSNTGKG